MFIKSKLSASCNVVLYAPLQSGSTALHPIKSVTIKGGANVQDKKTLEAPDGIIQEIADADWEAIKDHAWVKFQIEKGFIVPYTSKPKEKFSDMAEKDKSAQLTENDYKKRGKKAPKAVRGNDDDSEGDFN